MILHVALLNISGALMRAAHVVFNPGVQVVICATETQAKKEFAAIAAEIDALSLPTEEAAHETDGDEQAEPRHKERSPRNASEKDAQGPALKYNPG